MEKIISENTETKKETNNSTTTTTTTTQPTLDEIKDLIPVVDYSSTIKKEYKFKITQLSKLNSSQLKEIVDFITKIYVNQEPITVTLGFTYEEMIHYISFITEKNIETGFGVIATETNSNTIAGVILSEDLNQVIDGHSFACEKSSEYAKKYSILKEAIKPIMEKNSVHFKNHFCLEKINLKVMAVSQKFQNFGLCGRMIKYLIHEHPILKHSFIYMNTSSSVTSQTAFTKNGFKTLYSQDYSEIKVNNDFPFKDMEDKLTTEKNLASTNELKIMFYEKKTEIKQPVLRESDYVEQLEMNHNNCVLHKNELEYENQKTKFGEAFLISEIKKKDIVNLFNQPCIISEIIYSKKGYWVLATNIENYNQIDIVYPTYELIEKLDYNLSYYTLLEIKDSYAKIQKAEEIVQLPLPSHEKEIKLFEKITTSFKSNLTVELEVIEIMGRKKIVNMK